MPHLVQNAIQSSIDLTCPYRCTSTTALVLDETHRLTLSIERRAVFGSTSAKTGVAPARKMASTVAKAVIGLVITSSPRPMSRARMAISLASIPLPTPSPCLTPHADAHCLSNATTSLPSTYQPESSTRRTALSIDSRSSRGSTLKSFIKIIDRCPGGAGGGRGGGRAGGGS